jgi:hypothetical protein
LSYFSAPVVSKLCDLRMLVALLVVITFSNCGATPDPPAWSVVLKYASVNTPPETSQSATDHLVVYIDESASMAGYITPDGNTIYGRTLQEIRNVATTLDPYVSVFTRRVDLNVGAPTNNPNEIGRASVDPKLYNGGETDIAGAIVRFTDSLQPGQPSPPRFHIIVTDGVQSTNPKPKGNCQAGSDEICVRERLLGLVKSGWGGCILGIRSQFHGKIYSEINKARGGIYAIPYDSQDNRPETLRPFYLYIFSPDSSALDKLVGALKDRLRSFVAKEGLRELPLTLPYTSGVTSGTLEIAKESKEALEASKSKNESGARMTMRVDFDTDRTGPKGFNVVATIPWSGHAADTANELELANLVRWELVEVYPPRSDSQKADSKGEVGKADRIRYPELKYIDSQSNPDGKVVVRMTAQWPQGTGNPAWRVYKLSGYLNLERQAPSWIQNQQWSTDLDTKSEMGNRTLYLETALSNLWRNEVLKNRPVAELYVRVGPK